MVFEVTTCRDIVMKVAVESIGIRMYVLLFSVIYSHYLGLTQMSDSNYDMFLFHSVTAVPDIRDKVGNFVLGLFQYLHCLQLALQ